MTDEVSAWRERVAQAAMVSDAAALRSLYAEGRDLLGNCLGEEWAVALSALDGSAVTG